MTFGDPIIRQNSQSINVMNVNTILNNTLSLVTPNMHKMRRMALSACVHSLITGNSATITSMGRGIDSKAHEKHSIKRADRLCSNSHLLLEADDIYTKICHLYVCISGRPVILVDWSDLDESKRHFLLRASLAFEGRSITLYQEVHGLKTKEKPAVHQQFLSTLKTMLGDDVKPIIVTDAGFKVPWFRQILNLGWDFVGRTRQPNTFSFDNGKSWDNITMLFKRAKSTPKVFSGHITKNNPIACRLVLYKQVMKGRHNVNRDGQPKQSGASKTHSKAGKEPWLLSTSLKMNSKLAKQAISIYRTRMQIEEEFRDMKSRLYGLGFEHNKTKILRRLTLLILIATLACLVATLIGLTAISAGLHRRYQANTVKDKRVLSYQFLGRRVIKDTRVRLLKHHLMEAIKTLKLGIQIACAGVS
jgi:hypothetical protein